MMFIPVAQTWVTKPLGLDKELRFKVMGSSIQKLQQLKNKLLWKFRKGDKKACVILVMKNMNQGTNVKGYLC